MQNKASFYVVLGIEILAILLAVFWVLPREIVLVATGIMVFYFIFSRVEDSLTLFILSIPLFVALPITDGFDTMANWRILLAILFLVWFFKKGYVKKILKEGFCCSPIIQIKSNLSKFIFIFLGIGVLSLVVATNQIVGIKKLLFLINIFLLFPIIRDVAKDERMRLKIIKAGAVALIISLIVGCVQVISTIFSPLYSFWQWWSNNVISVFYGNNLSELVKTRNTWFSYYPDSPPTLRMFSVFPDSHSFAMFVIIGLIFSVYLILSHQKRNLGKTLIWTAIILSFLALISSGSRGVWLSAVLPFLTALFLLIFKKQKIFKSFLIMLIIFILSFPVSSLILSQSHRDGNEATLAFKRAKSIADLEELSVKSRIGIWKATFRSILKHPLLGVGIGNYPIILDEDVSAAKKGASAHNLYLDVASETGLLGLIASLLIFLEILRRCWRFIKKNGYILYITCFLFFYVWLLIYNLFDVVLLNDKVLLLFMVALGIVYYEQISINQHSSL
jgi:O-antigen ligase